MFNIFPDGERGRNLLNVSIEVSEDNVSDLSGLQPKVNIIDNLLGFKQFSHLYFLFLLNKLRNI